MSCGDMRIRIRAAQRDIVRSLAFDEHASWGLTDGQVNRLSSPCQQDWPHCRSVLLRQGHLFNGFGVSYIAGRGAGPRGCIPVAR